MEMKNKEIAKTAQGDSAIESDPTCIYRGVKLEGFHHTSSFLHSRRVNQPAEKYTLISSSFMHV
jgi:hypothetical protein